MCRTPLFLLDTTMSAAFVLNLKSVSIALRERFRAEKKYSRKDAKTQRQFPSRLCVFARILSNQRFSTSNKKPKKHNLGYRSLFRKIHDAQLNDNFNPFDGTPNGEVISTHLSKVKL